MEQEKNKNGIIIALIIVIVVLLALVVLLATGTIDFKSANRSSNQNNEINNNEETAPIDENDFEYKIESKTNAQVDLLWNNENYEINVVDGNLKVNDKTFTITDEKIKYFYFQRYQSSHNTVFHYLTEKGNIYVTEVSVEKGIDSFNDFKKLNYSNVQDIVVLPNDNYGKTYDEVSGIVDHRETYLYALVDGETKKLDYQYNY